MVAWRVDAEGVQGVGGLGVLSRGHLGMETPIGGDEAEAGRVEDALGADDIGPPVQVGGGADAA